MFKASADLNHLPFIMTTISSAGLLLWKGSHLFSVMDFGVLCQPMLCMYLLLIWYFFVIHLLSSVYLLYYTWWFERSIFFSFVSLLCSVLSLEKLGDTSQGF